MPILELQTTEGVVLDLEVAGAGSRFAAALVDLVLFGLTMLLVLLGLSVLSGFDPSGASAFVLGLIALGGPLVFALTQAAWQLVHGGATPGKQLLGLRVVAEDGRPAGARAQILRSLAWMVDCLPLPLPIGLMIVAAHPKRQRLGDILAGTLVARVPVASEGEPWSGTSWSELEPKTLPLTQGMVLQLDGEDLALIRGLVLRRGLDPDARQRVIRGMARHYAERLGLEARGDPQRMLRELYLCLRESRRGTSPD
jgi:uncharacterized RDD family membrane protein YckC